MSGDQTGEHAVLPDIAVAPPQITGDVDPTPPLLDAGQGFTVRTDVTNTSSVNAGTFQIELRAVIDAANQQPLGSVTVMSQSCQ